MAVASVLPPTVSTTPAHRCDCRGFAEASSLPTTWVATVPGTYPTPEAGTCTPYVQYVGPGGKPPCASGTYPTREAGTRSLYVPNGGRGAYGTCQLSAAPVLAALHATPRHAFDVEGRAILVERRRVRRQPAIMRAELEHVQRPAAPARRARVHEAGGNSGQPVRF